MVHLSHLKLYKRLVSALLIEKRKVKIANICSPSLNELILRCCFEGCITKKEKLPQKGYKEFSKF